MQNPLRNVVALSALLFVFACPAWPQAATDAKQCFWNHADPDTTVQFCTAALASGQVPADELADAFRTRGNAYVRMHDSDRAIQDLNEAIRMYPQIMDRKPRDKAAARLAQIFLAESFYSRGNAYSRKGDYDHAIQDYSEAIRVLPPNDGAISSRGIAYANKGDYDHAIQDFNEVIRINPQDGPRFTLSSRGNAYKGKGDYDRALQDFNEALRLNPKDVLALDSLGTIFYERADFDRAIQHFGQAVKVLSADPYRPISDPSNYFAPLWLYLARARGGGEAAGELKQNALRLDQAKWPGPIIRLYLGDLTPEDVWQAAQDPDPKKNVDNACSANFFIGEYERLHGKNSEAVTLLRKAKDICPPNFKEHFAAQSELAQLENSPEHCLARRLRITLTDPL